MLKVVLKVSMKDVDAFLLNVRNHVMRCMRDALVALCKECEEKARNNDGGWRNRTGNLRSSIGGAVYEHGKVYFETEFSQILNGSQGVTEGRNMIRQLASSYSDAVAMVIVAAMDYADEVEAYESKDVIESTRIYAESVVQNRLDAAKEQAIKEINSWKL